MQIGNERRNEFMNLQRQNHTVKWRTMNDSTRCGYEQPCQGQLRPRYARTWIAISWCSDRISIWEGIEGNSASTVAGYHRRRNDIIRPEPKQKHSRSTLI